MVADALGLTPSQCLVIEDHPVGRGGRSRRPG